MTAGQFSKTEARRRLRELSRQFRARERVAANSPVDVQVRVHPVVGGPDTPDLPGDDMVDALPAGTAAATDHVRTPGAIVHLMLYTNSPTWGRELVDVQRAWMGTTDRPPQIRWR